jgi:phosphohistidine phosphatase SixA
MTAPRSETCRTKAVAHAQRVGQAFREHDVPVGDVLTSQYARCLDTAKLAFDQLA